MATEQGPASPGQDDFDRQLRELTSGSAGAARFREPSAAERARQAGQQPRRKASRLRNLGRARQLRRPMSAPGSTRGGPSRWRRARLRVVGGSSSRRPAPGARRARIRAVAKATAILAGFVALLIVLHLLGLGPQ